MTELKPAGTDENAATVPGTEDDGPRSAQPMATRAAALPMVNRRTLFIAVSKVRDLRRPSPGCKRDTDCAADPYLILAVTPKRIVRPGNTVMLSGSPRCTFVRLSPDMVKEKFDVRSRENEARRRVTPS